MRTIYTLITLFSFFITEAQVTFSNQSQLLSNSSFVSDQPSIIADMNGDNLDDIVRIGDDFNGGSNLLSIEYQQAPGTNFSNYSFSNPTSQPWGMAAADIDNNGYNDITVGDNGNAFLLTANSNGTAYSTTMFNEYIFVQGINFADIDNDGDSDLFACHDVGTSISWENNGAGLFSMNQNLISTAPYSGNYASVWTDYDCDGDIDLYVSKCRLGVTDPTSPFLINGLYRNNGDGTYTEMAASAGVAGGEQSWASDFADIDNDGDMDLFVLNHTGTNKLYINNNNLFTDMIAGSGISTTGPGDWQSLFRDFDNDGYVDLLVSGFNNKIYWNNGDNTFTPGVVYPSQSFKNFSVGDLNHDGFLDVFANFNAWSGASGGADKILFNNANSNNFMVFNLSGVQSNPNGIGAKLRLYSNGVCQIREVRSGESYGIMNSFSQHFGLGSNTTVDSLVINWPSGIVQKIEGLTVNSFVDVVEEPMSLPLSWLHFSAELKKESVMLLWEIADEFNNDHFEIERSKDARNFEMIGQVNQSQSTHYHFEDTHPLAGKSYYRLKQVDLDGKSSYSALKSIDNYRQGVDLTILPNPVYQNESLKVILNGNRLSSNYDLKIIATNGMVMKATTLSSGLNELDLNLGNGLYFIGIFQDGNLIRTEKILFKK